MLRLRSPCRMRSLLIRSGQLRHYQTALESSRLAASGCARRRRLPDANLRSRTGGWSHERGSVFRNEGRRSALLLLWALRPWSSPCCRRSADHRGEYPPGIERRGDADGSRHRGSAQRLRLVRLPSIRVFSYRIDTPKSQSYNAGGGVTFTLSVAATGSNKDKYFDYIVNGAAVYAFGVEGGTNSAKYRYPSASPANVSHLAGVCETWRQDSVFGCEASCPSPGC